VIRRVFARLHPRKVRAGFRKRWKTLHDSEWAFRARAARLIALRHAARLDPTRQPLPSGVNLVGYFEGSLGLGEAVRLVGGALADSSIPCAFASIPTQRDTQEARVPLGRELPYSTTIVHTSPFEVDSLVRHFGRRALAAERLVGLWYWELEHIPPELRVMADVFDELWVASTWLRDQLAPRVRCPVYAFPFPVDRLALTRVPKGTELPIAIPEDRFVFLTMFDHHSSYERKNPEGTLRAYLEAFPEPNAQTMLVVKSLHASAAPEKQARLESLAADRPDICVFDADLDKHQMDALFARGDCFVSLHRAEGLGLGFLDALRNGKRAIVTDYSAPSEFAGVPGLELVPYRRVPIETDYVAYSRHGEWAEPDVAAAGAAMRRASDGLPSIGVSTEGGTLAHHSSAAFVGFVKARCA